MKKNLLLVFILVFSFGISNGQNVEFSKDNFPDKKKELKDLLNEIKEQEYYFNFYDSVTYSSFIQTFEKAYEFNPENALNNFRLGTCYIYNNKIDRGLELLEDSYARKSDADPMQLFYLAKANHFKGNYKEAIELYKKFKPVGTQASLTGSVSSASKSINECKNAIKYSKKPQRVWIDNLGEEINSEYPEYSSFISADQSRMIYVARRPSTTGGIVHEQDNMYMEDIMIAEKKDGKWQAAKEMSKPVNTDDHDAPAGLSPDGKVMFIYRGDVGLGDIFISTIQEDGKWSKPEPIKEINEGASRESSACLSYDGKRLYFVSDRFGGYGDDDIWYVDWVEEKEKWGKPVNLGQTVNTKYKERGVFMHPDGKTMFFSSNGHKNIGGLDIYSSKFEKNKWSKPENIGMPINTPLNDVFFVLAANGRHAYYTSNRSDSYGEKDIYKITFLGPIKEPITVTSDNLIASLSKPMKEDVVEPEVNMGTTRLAILKGVIRDEKTQEPLEAELELVDNETGKIIATFKSEGGTGKYLISLPAGKNYGIAVKKEEYLFHSVNVNIPDLSGYREYEKDVDLKKLEVGKSIVLRNIFYDLDKYDLRSESKTELDRLIKLMNDNPTLKIELGAHTDTRGSETYNQTLSENRAKSVVDYLIKEGISEDRMVSKGYGEKTNIFTDSDISGLKTNTEKEEAHQQNRRTEFKVLEI